jgi:hypothetical protein
MQTGNNSCPRAGLVPENMQYIELVLRVEVIGRLIQQIDIG